MEHPAAQLVLIQSIFDLVMGVVKKARGYILEHKDKPLSVPDLCNVLHVSRRTLQYAF